MLVAGISQSGETIDTVWAMEAAKERGARLIALSNVPGSQATRISAGVLYTHAGPEIGVASTKAFTTQLVALYLLALYLRQQQGRAIEPEPARAARPPAAGDLRGAGARGRDRGARRARYHTATDFLFLGRGIHFPVALEGALKLKEISYIHAEGYPAGEMKHGPIALIDENLPVVAIATGKRVFEKVKSNLQEVKARDGNVIVVTDRDPAELDGVADHVLRVPALPEALSADRDGRSRSSSSPTRSASAAAPTSTSRATSPRASPSSSAVPPPRGAAGQEHFRSTLLSGRSPRSVETSRIPGSAAPYERTGRMRIFRWRPGSVGVTFCLTLLLGAAASSADVIHLIASESARVAAVSSHSDGGFTVAWTQDGSAGSYFAQLYLQRFDVGGTPAAPRRLVAETLLSHYVLVSTDTGGNDLVVWLEGLGQPHTDVQLVAAAFSTSGEPLWGPTVITSLSSGGWRSESVAPSPAGGWIAAWIGSQPVPPDTVLVQARRLDPVTGAGEATTILDPGLHPGPTTLAVAGSASRMLLVWGEKIGDGPEDTSTYRAFGQLLDGQGQPAAPIRDLGVAGIGPRAILDLQAAGFGQDRFFAAWNTKASQTSPRLIGGLALNGDVPVGSPFVIRSSDLDRASPLSLGVDGVGRAILGWWEETFVPPGISREVVYRFSVNSAPLSGLEEVSSFPGFNSTSPAAVSAAPDGHWIAVWPSVAGIDALLGVSVDGCATETNALCLTGNRFRVTATYHDHLGRDGVGVAAPLTSESGTFWFFSPDNVELILKVVDACSHPDFHNFWVFASGLTDVQVHLEVVDTWTGATWERDTALGEPFPPALDTAAFDTCEATPARSNP